MTGPSTGGAGRDGAASPSQLAVEDTASSGGDQPGGSEVDAARGPAPRALAVGDRIGRYELEGELGEGGMATVYRARDRELRREVAIKVLFSHLARRRELVARFHREGRAVAALDHRHILRVFDVGGGEDGEPPYLVLELVRGASLAEADTPLLAEVAAAIGVALCEALAVAHRAGIVHRDVKPANVMVAEGGRVVLGDFGVARVTGEDSIVTRTGAVLGTPAFMAPEQALGGELDPRSDLYSVGATLYALATGSLPFSGNAAVVVGAIVAGKLVPPLRRRPAVGPELARVIERLMAVDPEARYQDAGEAAAALREVVRAGGFDDGEALLAEALGEGGRSGDELAAVAAEATLARARAAAEAGQLPRAMALCDRVLALSPDSAEALALVESLGARGRRGIWAAGGAIAVALAGAALWWSGAGGEPAQALAVADAAVVVAAPPDAAGQGLTAARAPDAAALADAADAAAAEPEREPAARPERGGRDQLARSERVRRRRAAATQPAERTAEPRPADAAPPAPEPEPEPEPAAITFDIRPWCDLRIDGEPRGRADRRRAVTLAPGAHQIVCEQPSTGARWQTTLTVAAGERRTVRGTVHDELTVAVDLAGGDAVRVAGHGVVASGGSLQLRPTRARVEILRAGAPVAHAYITFRRDCTLRDRPRLGCY